MLLNIRVMNNWTTEQMPHQEGKVAIITGGNTGLGYEISKQLAGKNAKVIIACRTASKGRNAIEQIEKELGRAITADVFPLDLISIDSIRTFTDWFKEKHNRLDLLINNAGVVNLKEKTSTPTGLEMHMATNHLGHFALTGLLFETLKNTSNSRVVTMSSGAHKAGNINFDDFNWEARIYNRGKSYGDSKLANLLFVRSLQQRFDEENASSLSVAAHPGLSATERQQTIGIGGWLSRILAQAVWMGALPALKAATDPHVKPMEYYGPQYGLRGYPSLARMDRKAFDKTTADRLWKLSEEITGIRF